MKLLLRVANVGFLPTVPDHGWSLEEDNKLEGVVGCFVALSSASHHTISSSWNFYVQVIQNFVYWFHFANISIMLKL